MEVGAAAARPREARDGNDLLLWDADLLPRARPHHFDPGWWAERGELDSPPGGRGSAWFVNAPEGRWLLRHYRRGGLVARLIEDRYLWLGADRSRAFAEWHLLAELVRRGLPAPRPVAARVQRHGWRYRADLITVAVEDAESLAERLRRRPLEAGQWQALGRLLARFHAAGAYHHDLNAHNILIDDHGGFTLIDFDRGRIRRPGRWGRRNLARLRRSLEKLAGQAPGLHFHEMDWQTLYSGYLTAPSRGPGLRS